MHYNTTLLIFISHSRSSVAMHLRCGGIFNGYFITGLQLSVPVEEF